MGRHTADAPVDAPTGSIPVQAPARAWSDSNPVTDPNIFDVPLPTRAGQTLLPAPRPAPTAVLPVIPVAPVIPMAVAEPVAPQTTRAVGGTLQRPPAPVAPQLLPLPRAAIDARRGVRPATGLAPRSTAASLIFPPRNYSAPSRDRTEQEAVPPSLRKSGVSIAVCAVALLGAVSATALLFPTGAASAQGAPSAADVPMPKQDAASKALIRHLLHDRKAHRTRHHHRSQTAAAAAATAAATAAARETAAPKPSATTTRHAAALARPTHSASVAPSSTPSGSSTPSTPPSSADLWSPSGVVRALRTILGAAVSGKIIDLGAGTFDWSDFGSNLVGLDASSAVGGFHGAGVSKTILQMTPHTSTKAGAVPTATGTTNNLSLMRVTGSPSLSDFTLRATAQGHLYNGLRVHQATNARITDVRVDSVPGNFDSPPGETFGINDFRTTGSVYRGVEVDGGGVAGANLGTNNSTDVTIEDSYFHDSGYSHGATFWQTRDVTVKNTESANNKDTGFNFERVTGNVLLQNDYTHGNKLADIRIGNDQGSAKYTIVNPRYSGSKLRIMLTPIYMGHTNLQKKSDIHVIVNGVDRTSQVVEWVTHW